MFRLALLQLRSTADKQHNLRQAYDAIIKAGKDGANVVALPECFNSPYGTQYFADYAEPVPGPTTEMLSRAAREASVYLIGGSHPERASTGNIFNTCTIFDRAGAMVAVHRKLHLFDINVPGKIVFRESEVLTAGSTFTHFDTEYGKIGVGICYDMRFPELALRASREGCKLLVFPGAFNMVTGPLHWELLLRARAVDQQMYVAAVSPARDTSATYIAWGHSTIVDPWGKVIATTEDDEATVTATIDPAAMDDVRASIPIRNQRRTDLYETAFTA